MRICRVALPLFLFLSLSAVAQTTGGISGRVTDSTGAVLPGVTVELRSDALQGVRTDVTASDGTYRFSLLPPGGYDVRFALEGFAPEVRHGVRVLFGKDTPFNPMLRPATMDIGLTISAARCSINGGVSKRPTMLRGRR
jgi:hypothetical protein